VQDKLGRGEHIPGHMVGSDFGVRDKLQNEPRIEYRSDFEAKVEMALGHDSEV
jgi:hypothetical protein